jgi:type III pantothenate kinase
MTNWIGLVIGNSRLHWAWFTAESLQATWDTPHLVAKVDPIQFFNQHLPSEYYQLDNHLPTIYLASVVPLQTALWLNYPYIQQIILKDIPLHNTYPTLGIDRALAIYGAGETYHYPSLVIDAGTALTFTGVDRHKTLIGGAILPGLKTQFRALHQQTAALPQILLPDDLPPRWATNTKKAIASGIIYTTIAGIYNYINNWLDLYPHSSIILTGGDSQIIWQYLNTLHPQTAQITLVDRNLTFWAMRSLFLRNNTQ